MLHYKEYIGLIRHKQAQATSSYRMSYVIMPDEDTTLHVSRYG